MELSSRATYRGQITKLAKCASEYLSSPEAQAKESNIDNLEVAEEELAVLLQRITTAHESLTKANNEVRALIKPEEFDKENESIADYTDKAVSIIARITQRLSKIRSVQGRISTFPQGNSTTDTPNLRGTSTKLPKLPLVKFSGKLSEWLLFWQQFRTTVHDNTNLSAADKFNYLQSVLSGKAAESIAGFTPTESCYDGAIALLKEEYGDNERLTDQVIQQLLSLQPVTNRNDAFHLRRLYNAVISSTRSLTALGVSPTSYSIVLKSVFLRCMPNELRVDFHKISPKTDDSKEQDSCDNNSERGTSISFTGDEQVSALLKFLKREVESLEKSAAAKSTQPQTSSKSYQTAAGLLASNDREVCFFCKSNQHSTESCCSSHTLTQRKELLKRDGRCFRCTKRGHSAKMCKNRSLKCSQCSGNHAYCMCDPNYRSNKADSSYKQQPNFNANSLPQKTVNLCSQNADPYSNANIYLQTACALISSPADTSRSLYVRLVLDGGSQYTYVKASVVRQLNMEIIGKQRIKILPFGSSTRPPTQVCNRVKFILYSQYDNQRIEMTALEVPEICLDILPIPNKSNPEFSKFILADARQADNLQDGISLLIGSDFYWKIVTGELRRIDNNLTAVNSILGWTIQGPAKEIKDCNQYACLMATTLNCSCSPDYEFDMSRFWDLECIGISVKGENEIIDDVDKYIRKIGDRYEASLLWKSEDCALNNYRKEAITRLNNLINKLSKDPSKLKNYDREMRDFIACGFAEKIPTPISSQNRVYYMPHRPVYRDDKATTKLRIVFDASASSGDNLSLNKFLSTGPNLLPNVLTILLNFRIGKIGIVADIEKAFLQILLSKQDRDVHRFFWFDEELELSKDLPPPQEYRMTRVTFGVSCSPFLLSAVLRKHFEEQLITFPETSRVLLNSFYMDDLVTSVDEEEIAKTIYRETRLILKDASMHIRKWNSNAPNIRLHFGKYDNPPIMQKVLGMRWCCLTDEISVELDQLLEITPQLMVNGTKRNVLKLVSRIYDPLGILGPYVIRLKILFQEIWRLKLDWDVMLPDNMLKIWRSCCSDVKRLNEISLPRQVFTSSPIVSAQLHVFSDASLQAYGAVAFVRTVGRDGVVCVKYLCSKNRVAPLKIKDSDSLTLPKLELTAALIAARLVNYLQGHMNKNKKFDSITCWCDSKITLYWIHGDLSKWKPYVAHRVKEIRQVTFLDSWRYCPGDQNPADLLTRGLSPESLCKASTWISGPSWLSDGSDNWPKTDFKMQNLTSLVCLQVVADNATSELNDETILNIEDYSNYRRLLRVTAYVQRFVAALHKRRPSNRYLKSDELLQAEYYWVKRIQEHHYKEELTALQKGKSITTSSKIYTLNPMIDDYGILRVRSRLIKLNDDFVSAFPIILPKSEHLTRLIAVDAHHRALHGGVNLVITRLREKFWIVKARQLARSITHQCYLCRRLRGNAASQPFATLPRSRLSASRPFETTGIDFAGPLHAKLLATDEGTRKMYIMLLTCAAVRAIHLELVPSLSTESCLLALYITSRNSKPHHIR